MKLYRLLVVALALSVLSMGCEGDVPLRMVQRDVDTMRSEVAAVARTGEGNRAFIEDRLRKVEDRLERSERARAALEDKLGKVESELKSQAAKVAQERQERQAFLQSQAALSVKLDELTTGVRLAQGQTEGIGHGFTEINRRVDELGRQVDQVGRRMNGSDTQINQAVSAAQEATAASQQTAQQVTVALQQMAQQTNAAIEQVNATAQLALAEARKTAKGKPAGSTAGPSRISPPSLAAPAVPVTAPAQVRPTPTATAPTHAAGSSLPAAPTTEPPLPPIPDTGPAARTENAGELYRNALNDYAKGDYELAINGFRHYIELYPGSSLLPNVRYWLGESYYSQKNYDQAIKEFALLVKQHPENPKVASAMLKQGFAYLESGDKSKGRTMLDTLLKQFPKSQEARWAKQRLGQMK